MPRRQRRKVEAYQSFRCGLCGKTHSCRLEFREAFVHHGYVLVKACQVGAGCPQWFYQEMLPARYVEIAKKLDLEYMVNNLNLD